MGERDHLKFGYEAMIEKRELRERLSREGVAGMALHFAVEREYERAHANDPTYREISAAFSARCKAKAEINVIFTIPELLDIAERYAGANTEVGQAIAAKIKERFDADDSGSLPDRLEAPVASDQGR